jgi:hypothetical protein
MSLASESNAPDDCPPLKPMSGDLLNALALEMFEHDTLRAEHGLPPRDGRRVFSRQDRQKGESLGPLAMLDQSDGEMVVKLTN